MSRIVYVNKHFLPADEANISIFDRGFLFGDGVYEVVPVINGKLADKNYFLERLDSSLSKLQIAWPCSQADYIDVHEQLIKRNQLKEGSIYSQVTRGVAERDFAFPAAVNSSFIAFTSERELLNNPVAKQGIRVISTDDLRWKRRDIKSINLLGQCLAKQDAVSRGADEGWMVEDGFVTEGVTSSAYIVKHGTVITRPLSNEILPGIRRRVLLEIAAENQIKVEQRRFTIEEAKQADEAFISSANTLALSVISIDGVAIGDGKPGRLTRRLRELYRQRMETETA